MAVVYGRCYDEIGAFNDTKFIVGMLERVSSSAESDATFCWLLKTYLFCVSFCDVDRIITVSWL